MQKYIVTTLCPNMKVLMVSQSLRKWLQGKYYILVEKGLKNKPNDWENLVAIGCC